MYLKCLELNGFKSFADKTKLDFEPGLMAIVGPNGCGKSNVSDAVRWVLGEQSAKALRGSNMVDVIFNGTDNRKPMGMAEVNLTFADCEKTLGTEYNEVTITRRVFRSGEGQYFINKTPCRLKDIQRLFMDTGVGTDSYSLMEQGRIDRILSSRPEDRREIFEEASGITKFKADKKEAIRKLEQTEANLLRLADVIREVKRQIGSLQRQAGKARRYKEMIDQLRSLEVFLTQERLKSSDNEIEKLSDEINSLNDRISACQSEVKDLEDGSNSLRNTITKTDREISSFHEAGVQAQGKLDHTNEMIAIYTERIQEYRSRAARDTNEVDETKAQLEERSGILTDTSARLKAAAADKTRADSELSEMTERFEKHRIEIDEARSRIQKLRNDSATLESTSTRLQNEMIEIEAHERENVLQRERLSAEKSQISRIVANYEKRQIEMLKELEQLSSEVRKLQEGLKAVEDQKIAKENKLKGLHAELSDTQASISAIQTKKEMIIDHEADESDFPGGSKLLLDAANPLNIESGVILGALASHVEVELEYRAPFETAMRSWLDAIVAVNPSGAVSLLKKLEGAKKGSARILSAPSRNPDNVTSKVGVRLVDHVSCSDSVLKIIKSLLYNVYVVNSVQDIPSSIESDIVYVTRSGALISSNGCAEFWMTEAKISNPFSRKHMLSDIEKELSNLLKKASQTRADIEKTQQEIFTLEDLISVSKAEVEKQSRALAQKEGEHQLVSRESKESKEKLETVSWELDSLNNQGKSGDDEKKAIVSQINHVRSERDEATRQIGIQTNELQQMENRHNELSVKLSDIRVRAASLAEKVSSLEQQHESIRLRIEEMEQIIKGRSQELVSYEENANKLEQDIKQSKTLISTLNDTIKANSEQAESLRKNREKQAEELAQMEKNLSHKREVQEDLRGRRSKLDVAVAENKLRRQNMIDRVLSEYSMTLDQLTTAPEPKWETEKPQLDGIETETAEIRTKIEAMGPVNLVAIEEYKELEERYQFLTTQEDDLNKSKQQLMELIRKINKTTSEMFKATFEQVNVNFDIMFKKLFNGGTAKLVLVNEEDLLECGIEIIARPPGKRLQNVSLLSGGERTMTAVALLFSIYMIKPSPFCMLDELDAALDDSNIGRFVNILKDFLELSQFVVITHNRQTIAAANILYGITMPEKGVTKIISVKFKDFEAVANELQVQPALQVKPSDD